MRLRIWGPALTALVAACSLNEPLTVLEQPITPVATRAWSGDTLLIHSRWFAGADTLPTILAGGASLTAAVADTYLVRVILPDTNGPVTLTARFAGGRMQEAGTIRVHGVARVMTAPAIHSFSAFVPGLPILRGQGADGTVELNVNSGFASIVWPAPRYRLPCALRGNLLSTTGKRVVLRADCTAAVLDYASGQLVVADSAYGSRLLMHVGPGRWVQAENHRARVVGASDSAWVDLEDPDDLVASPDGRFVFPINGWAALGVPVFDSSGVAYRFTDLSYVLAAAFSADGDTAYVLGLPFGGPQVMRIVEVATGATLREAPMPVCCVATMVADPGRPWLYAVDGDGPNVYVIDRETMTARATLRMPINSYIPRAHVDVGSRRLFVTQNYDWYNMDFTTEPTRILVFDLMP